MNSDSLTTLLQKGFRVSLGATATLIEILQDPQRREENLARLRLELSELAEEWAAKGAVTEQEARTFVDTILSQRPATSETERGDAAPADAATTDRASAAPVSAVPDVQNDLQDLTAQIAAIRAELEKLREQDSSR